MSRRCVVFSCASMLAGVLILIVTAALAQPPSLRWSRLYGGSQSDEFTTSICQNAEGNIFLAGTKDQGSDSPESSIFAILLEPANGDTIWTRTYSDSGYHANAYAAVSADDGFMIAGRVVGYGHYYLYLMRIDAAGDTLWTRRYAFNEFNAGWLAMVSDGNGGFIVTGGYTTYPTPYGSVFVFQLNANGDSIRTRYHVGNNEAFRVVTSIVRIENGFAVSGYIFGRGEAGVWLAKLDLDFDILWSRAYCDTSSCGPSSMALSSAVARCSDGGFVLAGQVESFIPNPDRFDGVVVRTNAIGDTLWQRVVGDRDSDQWFVDVVETGDGGFVCAGTSHSWQDADSGIAPWLVKFDSAGNVMWQILYPTGNPEHVELCEAMMQLRDGGFAIAGWSNNWTSRDSYLLCTGAEHMDNLVRRTRLPELISLRAYPNPFNPSTTLTFTLPTQSRVELSLFDLLGREVKTVLNEHRAAGEYRVTVNAADLPSGIYVARLEAGETVRSHKLLLLK